MNFIVLFYSQNSLYDQRNMKVIKPKPIYELQLQKRYVKHKHSLSNILNSPPNFVANQPTEQLKKLHQRSVSYHYQQERESINKQNCKIIQRLIDIASRKKDKKTKEKIPSIIQYNNPARKKRQKCITEMNSQLAQRIITKRSQFDHKEMQKGINQYKRLKKTLYNNKIAMSPCFLDRQLHQAQKGIIRQFCCFKNRGQSQDSAPEEQEDVKQHQELNKRMPSL